MDEWLASNLSVLERRSPDVARRILDTQPVGVERGEAADGTPILLANGMPLHNVHSPLAEARRWVAGQLDAPGHVQADCLLVLGFGAGHHLRELAAGWPRRIVAVEPSLEVLRAALGAFDLRDVLARIDLRCTAPDQGDIDALGNVGFLPFLPASAADRSGHRSIRRTIQGRVGVKHLRLKVLVVSPLVGGTLPMTDYAARALAKLGHAVSVLDMSPFCAGFKSVPAFGATGSRRQMLEARFIDWMADGVLQRVEYEQPDLVLAMALAPMTPRILDRLAKDGVKTALWFVEDFRRFDYWRDEGPHYRYVFSIQREECFDAFRTAGIVNASYLPCAADPMVHTPLRLTPEEAARFGSAVSFVGSGFRNRQVTFRRLVEFDFKVWGNGWEGAEGLWGSIVQQDGARVSTADSVRVFNASTINLNLHSSTYVDGVDPVGDFVNPRTFELAACGAFQLVDERRYLPELFTPGEEVITFGSPEELRDRVDYFLERPEERRAISEAARRRVLSEHTYEARMRCLLERIFSLDYEHFSACRSRTHGAAALVEAAGADTALGQFLERHGADDPDIDLDGLVGRIRTGQGPLSEEEEILVFLKQYDEMFLGAYRP